jgi:hypothetical protein
VLQVESSLDIQFIIAAGTGVPSDFWLEDGGNFDVMGWASFVLNTSTLTNQVIRIVTINACIVVLLIHECRSGA